MNDNEDVDGVPPVTANSEEAQAVISNIFCGIDGDFFLRRLLQCLSNDDMKKCRMINHSWNQIVQNDATFISKNKIVLRHNWNRNMERALYPISINWTHAEFQRFKSFSCTIFEQFWDIKAVNVTVIKFKRTQLECYDLRLILDRCFVLRALTLSKCALWDAMGEHSGKARPSLPLAEREPLDGLNNNLVAPLESLHLHKISKIQTCHLDYLAHRTGRIRELDISECFQVYRNPAIVKRDNHCNYNNLERSLRILFKRNAQTLTNFTIKNNYGQQAWCDWIRVNLPALRITQFEFEHEMNVERVVKEKPQSLLQFTQWQANNISSLYFRTKRSTDDNFINKILSPLVNLTKLDFFVSKWASDIRLDIVGQLPNLVSLSVTDIQCPRPFSNKSTLQPSFLNHLPSRLACLSVKHYFPTPIESCARFPNFWMFDLFSSALFPRHTPSNLPLKNITTLEIIVPDGVPEIWSWDLSMQMIIKFMPLLENLCLTCSNLSDKGLLGWTDDDCFKFKNCALYDIILNPMDITRGCNLELPNGPTIASNLRSLQNLKELNLSHNRGITNLSIFAAFILPNLTHLDLSGSTWITDRGMGILHKGVPNLETLFITSCPKVSQWGMNLAVRDCKKLRRLVGSAISISVPEVTKASFELSLSPYFYDVVRSSI